MAKCKPSVVQHSLGLYTLGLVFCHQALRTMLDPIRTYTYRSASKICMQAAVWSSQTGTHSHVGNTAPQTGRHRPVLPHIQGQCFICIRSRESKKHILRSALIRVYSVAVGKVTGSKVPCCTTGKDLQHTTDPYQNTPQCRT